MARCFAVVCTFAKVQTFNTSFFSDLQSGELGGKFEENVHYRVMEHSTRNALVLFLLASVCICSCAGNVCPETFIPYLNSSTCVKVVQPALQYTEAARQAASQADGLLEPSTNASMLRFYANVSGIVGALWVGDAESFQEGESSAEGSGNETSRNCPALDSDGIVRERQCSDVLPFAVVVQMRIPVRERYSTQFTYVARHSNVSLMAVAADDSGMVSGQWVRVRPSPAQSRPVFAQDGGRLVIDGFIGEVHEGRYDFIVSQGNISAIVDTRLLKEAVLANFSAEPQNHTVPMGQLIALECDSSDSRPAPNITWYRNEMIMVNVDCSTKSSTCISRLGTLFISNFNSSDQGAYSCTATNIAGTMRSRAGYLRLENNSTTLESNSVKFSLHPRTQTVLKNDAFSIECAAAFFTPVTANTHIFYYFLTPVSAPPVMLTYTSNQNNQPFPMMVYSSTMLENGRISNYSVTVIGVGPPSLFTPPMLSNRATITVQERATITRLSVSVDGIASTVSNQAVELGSNVNIACDFRGDPTPTLSWLHNGVNKKTVNMSSAAGLLQNTLTIGEFQCGDAGVYQCYVENAHQTSIQTVTLAAADARSRPGPVSFNVRSLSPTSLLISWSPVVIRDSLNPRLLQYRVLYRETNWLSNYLSSGLLIARNYTISGLEADTSYDVSVIAISVEGEGERAASMQVKTQPLAVTGLAGSPSVSASVNPSASTAVMQVIPTVGSVAPSNQSFIPLVISLGTVGAIILLVFVMFFVWEAKRRYWLRHGTKGNYSPANTEKRLNKKKAQRHSVPVTPIPTPPPYKEAFNSTFSEEEERAEVVVVENEMAIEEAGVTRVELGNQEEEGEEDVMVKENKIAVEESSEEAAVKLGKQETDKEEEEEEKEEEEEEEDVTVKENKMVVEEAVQKEAAVEEEEEEEEDVTVKENKMVVEEAVQKEAVVEEEEEEEEEEEGEDDYDTSLQTLSGVFDRLEPLRV